jgi:hypothetical protein
LKSTRGGPRPGSGRKKGSKWPSTLAKEAARELVRVEVTRNMPAMIEAQVRHSVGLSHLMLREADGTWKKAPPDMSADEMLAILNGDQARYYIATKDPSVQAFTDLMNRALDKPKEQAQAIDLNVHGDIAALIAEGRQRAAARNKKG